MAVSASDLRAHRDAQAGKPPASSGKERVDRVLRMFSPADEIKAIKDEPSDVTVGTPSTQLKLRPMSTQTLLESLQILKDLIGPLIQLSNREISIAQVIDVLGEKAQKLPELIFNILKRGNEQTVTLEWVNDHFDVMLDLQVVLPIFLKQNALDRLFGGGPASPKDGESPKEASSTTTISESSPE